MILRMKYPSMNEFIKSNFNGATDLTSNYFYKSDKKIKAGQMVKITKNGKKKVKKKK